MSPSDLQTRLVPLPDGRPGLRGGIPVDVQAPPDARANSCNSCLDFISSDATLDRYNEIIIPAGWNLTTYQRNPVFQNAHQYGDIIFTLGKALLTEIRTVAGRQALFQRIQFAVDANPVARIAYALYAGKFLNTVSVGFIPTRWENGTAESGFARKYLEQELLEVSAVAIPANPNAVALAYKSGALERSDLRETADLLRQLAAAPVPSPRGEGQGLSRHSVLASADEGEFPSAPTHPLLLLAREVAHLMKHI
jgi:phage head maturation protease